MANGFILTAGPANTPPDPIAEMLAVAAEAGLRVSVERGRLQVRGPRTADGRFVQSLLAAKHAILTYLLQPDTDEWELWDERAAIAEYDGKLSRVDAETMAWAQLQQRRQELGNYFENSAISVGPRST